MSDVVRVSPAEAKALVDKNNAQLVAAYESGFKFDAVTIDGAMPLDAFKEKLSEIAKDAEIIFY